MSDNTLTLPQVEPAALLCPDCQEPTLDHDQVTVFTRAQEDGHGISTRIENGAVTSMPDEMMTGNPSERRNGLVVRLRCLNCGARPYLELFQHKGSTYLGFI